jgi:hypothetical protein
LLDREKLRLVAEGMVPTHTPDTMA